MGVLNNYRNPCYLNWIKTYNIIMLFNPKHVIALPSYMSIRNGIFDKFALKKETKKPDKMEIKDKLVFYVMNWESADEIEYNNIGAFKTINSNMPGYYIVRWKDNAYILQEKYTCHAFDPTALIPEGELVFTAKFMTPTKKNSIGITSHMNQSLSW